MSVSLFQSTLVVLRRFAIAHDLLSIAHGFFGQECVVSPHPTALTGHRVAFIVSSYGARLDNRQGSV